MSNTETTADALAALYVQSFGGKQTGRYRIPAKQLRQLMQCKRLYPEDITTLTRALLERGFVFIDMDSFYVVLSANTFVNYRRVSAEAVDKVQGRMPTKSSAQKG